MTTVELTRFRVSPALGEALVATRSAMLRDFRLDRDGFLDAQLVRLADDEWLDIVSWRSSADLAASRAKGGNRPGIQAFFELIGEIISSEEGTLVDEPAWPGNAPG
ncbi:hypothetical protein [Plantactinospora soyae]|uniref:Quinol monooxygenase YgiN n=1 Tax=Plantactinospora soyae TaxID=1544732 RepID=A0A927M8J4_9ACTN|nr:hypothetical protein [Plantactinospora soyae]MBE1489939.1 quinol monooxygenase YgiN [Plantactinospora soyae]